METSSRRNQHLFVVRLWNEGEPPQPDHWRGCVEHVPSGNRMYFSSLADLNDFIALTLRKSVSSQVEPNR